MALPTVEEIVKAWRSVYVGHGVRTNKMRDDGKRYEVIRYHIGRVELIDAFNDADDAAAFAELSSDKHRAAAVLKLLQKNES